MEEKQRSSTNELKTPQTQRKKWYHLFSYVLLFLFIAVPGISVFGKTITYYYWALTRWSDKRVVCMLEITHEDLPTGNEILEQCGYDLYNEWVSTPTCEPASTGGDTSTCAGLYLRFFTSVEEEEDAGTGEETTVVEPTITGQEGVSVRLRISNCVPGTECEEAPKLTFVAAVEGAVEVPVGIAARVGSTQMSCEGRWCEFTLPGTPTKGQEVEYWAYYADGRHSPHQTFMLRNVALEDGKYRFDTIAEDLREYAPYGSMLWNVFPTLNHENWDMFMTPGSAVDLATDFNYALLAGKLIWYGYASGKDCANSGLLSNGAADACGIWAARDEIVRWQNQFDTLIYQYAIENEVPPHVLKAMIAQESQFWPEWDNLDEFGLGRLTDYGLDMILIWNEPFFKQVCEENFSQFLCQNGYFGLPMSDRALLRGSTLIAVGTDAEIDLLAKALAASMAQTTYVVESETGRKVSDKVSYEDMWAFSLANYHSGIGCMMDAIGEVESRNQKLEWDNVSVFLQQKEYCAGAASYIDRIFYYADEE
ncbi:MAG: hypothetical protein JW750_04100 [Anaerolineaceae bacterium]|nr:hypothetical protein [Anaerolineaceae bacterium]